MAIDIDLDEYQRRTTLSVKPFQQDLTELQQMTEPTQVRNIGLNMLLMALDLANNPRLAIVIPVRLTDTINLLMEFSTEGRRIVGIEFIEQRQNQQNQQNQQNPQQSQEGPDRQSDQERRVEPQHQMRDEQQQNEGRFRLHYVQKPRGNQQEEISEFDGSVNSNSSIDGSDSKNNRFQQKRNQEELDMKSDQETKIDRANRLNQDLIQNKRQSEQLQNRLSQPQLNRLQQQIKPNNFSENTAFKAIDSKVHCLKENSLDDSKHVDQLNRIEQIDKEQIKIKVEQHPGHAKNSLEIEAMINPESQQNPQVLIEQQSCIQLSGKNQNNRNLPFEKVNQNIGVRNNQNTCQNTKECMEVFQKNPIDQIGTKGNSRGEEERKGCWAWMKSAIKGKCFWK